MIKKRMIEQEYECCDLCHADLTDRARQVINNSQFINRDGWTETLVCYKCTNEKLIPWLESQKVKPTESDLCSCEGLVCFPGSPIKCFTESQEDINQ